MSDWEQRGLKTAASKRMRVFGNKENVHISPHTQSRFWRWFMWSFSSVSSIISPLAVSHCANSSAIKWFSLLCLPRWVGWGSWMWMFIVTDKSVFPPTEENKHCVQRKQQRDPHEPRLTDSIRQDTRDADREIILHRETLDTRGSESLVNFSFNWCTVREMHYNETKAVPDSRAWI